MANNKDFKVKNGIQPTVYNEGVGTVVSEVQGYYLSAASYDSVSFSVSAQTTGSDAYAMSFKSDGTKMYVMDAALDSIFQYTLSTAWDVSTASYDSVSFSTTSQEPSPASFTLSVDGTKLYVSGFTAPSSVYQYTLSTPWVISTASYDSKSLDITTQGSLAGGIDFSSDGTKLYVMELNTDDVFQYTLSTAWDISTASYDSKSLDASTQDYDIRSVQISEDGAKLYLTGYGNNGVYEYTLSAAYDISTATHTATFSVTLQDGAPADVFFKSGGDKMYILGDISDTIYQYSTALNTASLDLSTGAVFDYTPTSDVQVTVSNPAASGTVSQATLLLTGNSNTFDIANGSYDSKSFSVASQTSSERDVAFKSDGTKMYLASANPDYVYQYTLSTAWDVSTASYDSVFINVNAKEPVLTSVTFSSDGTKMYAAGPGNDQVHQYNLSTAWDLNTDSFGQSFNASSEVNLYCVRFKSDGTKMYLGQYSPNLVFQYSLSTAWDISTASYDNISTSLRNSTRAFHFDFNTDGTQLFVASTTNDEVYRMDLSTAWDISTASDSGVSFDISTQSDAPNGIRFKPDGTKMYIVDDTDNMVYQYSTESGITVTYDTDLEWSGGTAPTAPATGETDVITVSTRDGGTTYQAIQAIDGAN